MYAGSGPTLLLPLRWLTIEAKYYTQYLTFIRNRPTLEASITLSLILFYILAMWQAVNRGYGSVLLWGVVVPGRLAVALLAYFFDYLPHRPHFVTRKEDQFAATSVTSLWGADSAWLLTWPLLHQNYHNIHHLAPYVPFYQYSALWAALKTDLLRRGTQIKPIFGAGAASSSNAKQL